MLASAGEDKTTLVIEAFGDNKNPIDWILQEANELINTPNKIV